MRLLESEKVSVIDPSQLLRPEAEFADKPLASFRDYSIDSQDPIKERVRRTYEEMHTNQTVQFVQDKIQHWTRFDHFRSTIKDALIRLNDLVDESDPDVDLPNIVHAFQTAERIRLDFPDQDWFHLTGLIHDLGKVLAFYGESQWAVVGDTFVVGCEWGPDIVYRDSSFGNNPDLKDPRYNTKYGIYEPKCGIENLLLSWGHDEYLYRVLKHNKTTLPAEALAMIRFHSFYPWHTSNNYTHFMAPGDEKIKESVRKFNQYDLYTKSTKVPDVEALWPYYETLIDKYMPGILQW